MLKKYLSYNQWSEEADHLFPDWFLCQNLQMLSSAPFTFNLDLTFFFANFD